MASHGASNPVGDGEYIVVQGDCMASIAYEHGFREDYLWNHSANTALRAGRRDRRVLLPGDRVHIPPLDPTEYERATDCEHTFVLTISERLRIVLRDEHGKPRPSLKYILFIERVRIQSGTSGADGIIEASIKSNARDGFLVVVGKEADEHYELHLGSLDPPSVVTGYQARLNNLGFHCGEVDGIEGCHTTAAVREFQERHRLAVTGKMDDDTRDALVREHGF